MHNFFVINGHIFVCFRMVVCRDRHHIIYWISTVAAASTVVFKILHPTLQVLLKTVKLSKEYFTCKYIFYKSTVEQHISIRVLRVTTCIDSCQCISRHFLDIDNFSRFFLCSKSSRVNFHRDVEEMMEVGCCYYCCTRCCIKCWSCCQGNNDVIKVKNLQPKYQDVKNNPKSSYTVATSAPNSVSVMSGETMETTPSLVRKEVKPARELNMWVPHTHGVRNINTSTR